MRLDYRFVLGMQECDLLQTEGADLLHIDDDAFATTASVGNANREVVGFEFSHTAPVFLTARQGDADTVAGFDEAGTFAHDFLQFCFELGLERHFCSFDVLFGTSGLPFRATIHIKKLPIK